jgi:XTP/dITP diphosphohydrolase
MKIVLASHNSGKIKELTELLAPLQIELIPQSALGVDDVEETGLSFIENAILKARHAAKITGLPALADDSGLAVDALKGAPGIYSARYAGTNNSADNITKLLAELHDVSDENRNAHFHCILAFISHAADPMPLVCAGKWSGVILREPKGEGGFGYDPIFYIPSIKMSAAELPGVIKNKISHRGIALELLLKLLPEKL